MKHIVMLRINYQQDGKTLRWIFELPPIFIEVTVKVAHRKIILSLKLSENTIKEIF